MSPVLPCPACGRHVLRAEGSCPHCHTAMSGRDRATTSQAATSMALGLVALVGVGCGAAYGVPWTDKPTPTGGTETGTTETGTTETGTTTPTATTGDTGT